MAAESNEQWKPQPAGLYVNVDSADVTFQKALDGRAINGSVKELTDAIKEEVQSGYRGEARKPTAAPGLNSLNLFSRQ